MGPNWPRSGLGGECAAGHGLPRPHAPPCAAPPVSPQLPAQASLRAPADEAVCNGEPRARWGWAWLADVPSGRAGASRPLPSPPAPAAVGGATDPAATALLRAGLAWTALNENPGVERFFNVLTLSHDRRRAQGGGARGPGPRRAQPPGRACPGSMPRHRGVMLATTLPTPSLPHKHTNTRTQGRRIRLNHGGQEVPGLCDPVARPPPRTLAPCHLRCTPAAGLGTNRGAPRRPPPAPPAGTPRRMPLSGPRTSTSPTTPTL